ncbi:serine/threonine-protein kinase mTOR-like isoform X2 [Cyprinus carpio]|uniref:Serine/threonine-protein kinase mTOR-like isoform X2 n=1 Tax=Cyprinus carpio TaxID=7962 RepID=A0A9R0A5K3_CYPCA|nr:serine/threonine-protein kinase mTOR-like isoform X2 [Cyprinus carpio]
MKKLYVSTTALQKGPLPLRDDNGIVLLGERAAKCRAYAKALHYKELEFQKGPSPLILESLISINNKLQQPEAASGVLKYSMKHFGELACLQPGTFYFARPHK